jgi:hypothetical protein
MQKINYLSDFDLVLTLRDTSGEDIGVPEYAWEVWLYPQGSKSNKKIITSAEEGTAWYADDGHIHLYVENPRNWGSGELRVDFVAHYPNDRYPDGVQDVFNPIDDVGVELVRGVGDESAVSAEAEALLPYVRGEKGEQGERGEKGADGKDGKDMTYDDLTEAQLADLVERVAAKVESTRTRSYLVLN